MTEVWRWLEGRGAHHDVVRWARSYGDAWERAWSECPRGDWLLGIAARAGAEPRSVVRAACACAEEALTYLPEGEERPADAIAAARGWADGADRPSLRARLRAGLEAAIDEAPDPAVAAAAGAALAALMSVDSPEHAAGAAAAAVEAAVFDAGECAMMSAMAYTQERCATLVREHVARPALEPA